MKLAARRAQAVSVVAVLAVVIAAVAVSMDHIDVAVVCAVVLQALILLVLLDLRRSRRAALAVAKEQIKTLRRIDERVDNVALRSVTEARAAEIALSARLDATEAALLARIEDLQKHLDRGAEGA